MYKVTIRPSGQVFEVQDGESVLVAALRQDLVLPYSCKNGICGTCKGRIVEGTVEYGENQGKALTEDERRQGNALFCQATPSSDLTIEARLIRSTGDIQTKRLPCRVQGIEHVTSDVIILKLRLNERLQFVAGQYLEFILRDGSRRSFSMANAPHADEYVELHVRHVPGGQFTDHVFGSMKERDVLRIEGPLGTFFLREDSAKPVIFVASGTGFAPIKSIVETALYKGTARSMVLYWGGRRPKDLYMDAVAKSWDIPYVPVASDALAEDGWHGRTGFVHRAVMEDFPDLSGYQVYACGVPVMVESAKHDFTTHCNLPQDEFYADSFSTQADLEIHGG